MENQNRINFHAHDKALVKSCVHFYHDSWKRRHVALHDPEVQMKVLQDEVLNMLEEENKEEVEGLKIHVEVHDMNDNNASVDEIVL